MTEAAAVSPIFDVTDQTFETEVMQESMTTPVLLDFWAAWCEPCKTVGPILEKLANEYHGAFRLGKVDVEAQRELAGMFGIRNIPTVMLLKGGQPVDGFTGALTEGQVREFLQRHVQPLGAPPTAEEAVAVADAVPETPEAAVARLQQELANSPDNGELKVYLAQSHLHAGQIDAAEAAIASLPINLATDARVVRLRTELDLAHTLADAPSLADLQQRVQADGADWAARDLLGVRLLLEGDAEAGLEQFLLILQKARDWNDGQGKKRLLAAFATLEDAELVARYRRKMASMLF
ncbi:MAG: tetratricopeptide repeat protein [Rhodanobacter sp.]